MIFDFPLILLHGALGSAAQMDGLKQVLAPHYPAVYTLHFSGHGGTEMPYAPFSTRLFMYDVQRFMDENELPIAHFFGYSMGGYVALAFAAQEPDRVASVVTLGTKFEWTPETAARTAATLDMSKWQEKAPQFVDMLRARHAPSDVHQVVDKTKEMMLQLGNGAALDAADLSDILPPVLILVGDADNTVGQPESEWATGHILDAKLQVLPGVKHPFEQVNVQALSVHILAFQS